MVGYVFASIVNLLRLPADVNHPCWAVTLALVAQPFELVVWEPVQLAKRTAQRF